MERSFYEVLANRGALQTPDDIVGQELVTLPPWVRELRKRRNLVLMVVGIMGCTWTLAHFPEVSVSLEIPPPSSALQDRSLPLPPVGPRQRGFNPFLKPFLFQLGDSSKLSGLEREEILQSQYQQIINGLTGSAPAVEVQQDEATTVSIGGIPFATVLSVDCPDYYTRLSESSKRKLEQLLAEHWKRLLELDLAKEAFQRSPSYSATHPYMACLLFFVCLGLHGVTDVFSRRFLHTPGWSLKAFLWLSYLAVNVSMFPLLRPLAPVLINGALRPVFFFLISWTVAQMCYRMGCFFLDSYARAYVLGHRQRVDTLVHGGRFLIATVVALLGSAWFAASLGVDLGKIFAGAGVAGLALGVVGKDILVDYFYGFNILADDQFSLGDFIETPVSSGFVENFNLRTTRIRELDGGLSIVTNSKFTVIKNHSREFANADFRIGIAYGCQTDRPLALIREEVARLYEDKGGVLDPQPIFVGVQELAESAVVLRALVRTAPLQQWAVARQLNQRILQRFAEEGVELAVPVRQVWLMQPEPAKVL